MSPGGLGEEAGHTARGFIEAMKGQPALLAMIVANIALLVFMFYALHGSAKHRETLTNQVLENSKAIHELLANRAIACPP